MRSVAIVVVSTAMLTCGDLAVLCLEEFAASRVLVGCHQANCQQWTD